MDITRFGEICVLSAPAGSFQMFPENRVRGEFRVRISVEGRTGLEEPSLLEFLFQEEEMSV